MSLKLYQHSVHRPSALSWEQYTTFLGAIARREKESVARLTRDFKATQLQFTDSRLPGW